MDFYRPATKTVKKDKVDTLVLFPDFRVIKSQDLMVRGREIHAVWDEGKGLWSTDGYDLRRLVDAELMAYAEEHGIESIQTMESFTTGQWSKFKKYIKDLGDNSRPLDSKLTFLNTEVTKKDYVSRRLPYNLSKGDISAWDEIVGTLYDEEERVKIEWAIGSIFAGDSIRIEKFVVFFGPPGAGKGTILKIIEKLFEGYTTTFDAKALVGNSNSFATEMFRDNPLVAIQHDGDLSRINDNSLLNSIVSHDPITVNEKYKPGYRAHISAFLFMGTNTPVRITDAMSGMSRRLIDVSPSGKRFSAEHYRRLNEQVNFELGAIAHHCLNRYRKMGKNYYNSYFPHEMAFQTNVFWNFIETYFDLFQEQNNTTIKQAYALYKEYCADAGIEKGLLNQTQVRTELKSYFSEYHQRIMVDGMAQRHYFVGFTAQPFKIPMKLEDDVQAFSLILDQTISLLDLEYAELPAQGFKYSADGAEVPARSWSQVRTTLSEIDTSELHYVKIPETHIVIDFDLKDEDGEKSIERNLQAASEWPPTYAELSKGENGVHLHYVYEGDVRDLAQEYSEGIEVKTLLGNASLRRRLTKCNNVPIARINSGLPFKERKVLSAQAIQSERHLRSMVAANLQKKYNPGTKTSIDFIKHLLDEAYENGIKFDLSDMEGKIVAFGNNSSNQPLECLRIVQTMRFKSDPEAAASPMVSKAPVTRRLAYFDVETYPNLFVVCYEFEGSDEQYEMINPSPADIELLLTYDLVGFYNREYDNHMIYGALMGFNNEQLYKLSRALVSDKSVTAKFGEAYSLSYADILDYSSKKQSLKKFQIEYGLPHMEMDLPWNKPVPKNLWRKVVDYCKNDVRTTKAVAKKRAGDFAARQIMAELSGLTVNDTTRRHAQKFIFGNDRNPQTKFVYTKLAEEFPGYEFDKFGRQWIEETTGEDGKRQKFPKHKSFYRGEDPSEGGYVYAEPGIYEDVAVWDIASMHPTSIIQLNLFGPYTKNFEELVEARLAIKHGELDLAGVLMNGRLKAYLGEPEGAKALSEALKIVINTVYGLTSATFNNAFKDPRNDDNIVAKRGALFMIDLKHFVQEAGFQVVHIKTDSIKIPGCTEWFGEQIMEFGNKFGYTFEHETTYSKMCLVNDAVYIARVDTPTRIGFEEAWVVEHGDESTEEEIFIAWTQQRKIEWTATGAQFQNPYVFKTLFTGEPIEFRDLCVTKQVNKGHIYMDYSKDSSRTAHHPDEEMAFVGKTGLFVPVTNGFGGAVLYRVMRDEDGDADDKLYIVTGSKGYLWNEASMVEAKLSFEDSGKINLDGGIDMSYFQTLADNAMSAIEEYGSYADFVR